jgi:hypothetical protein
MLSQEEEREFRNQMRAEVYFPFLAMVIALAAGSFAIGLLLHAFSLI